MCRLVLLRNNGGRMLIASMTASGTERVSAIEQLAADQQLPLDVRLRDMLHFYAAHGTASTFIRSSVLFCKRV